jgi:hypothetical protein
MPANLPPRPGPSDQTLVLTRRPKSGFVNYPPFFQKRMVEGRARFMTKCDMLIGPCSCGYTHDEAEGWVREFLDMYNCRVETLILWGAELGSRGMVVEIPGYWKQAASYRDGRSTCDVLVGKCVCGETHGPHNGWVLRLLRMHQSVILNMPPVDAPAPNIQAVSMDICESTTLPGGPISYGETRQDTLRHRRRTRANSPTPIRAARTGATPSVAPPSPAPPSEDRAPRSSNMWGSFSLRDGPQDGPENERPTVEQIVHPSSPMGRWRDESSYLTVRDGVNRESRDGLNSAELQLVTDIMNGTPALPATRTPVSPREDVNGCDCADCRDLRGGDGGMRLAATNWVLDAKNVRDGDWSDGLKMDWALRNCNIEGVVPGWCNCSSCLAQRINSPLEAPHGV